MLTHTKIQRQNFKSKKMEKIFYGNSNLKGPGVSKLLSDKIDFK